MIATTVSLPGSNLRLLELKPVFVLFGPFPRELELEGGGLMEKFLLLLRDGLFFLFFAFGLLFFRGSVSRQAEEKD